MTNSNGECISLETMKKKKKTPGKKSFFRKAGEIPATL